MSDLNFFHKIFLLQEMDAAEVQEVLKIATPRPYPVGAVIIHEGEALEHSIRLSLVTRARCSSLSVRAWRAAPRIASAPSMAGKNRFKSFISIPPEIYLNSSGGYPQRRNL